MAQIVGFEIPIERLENLQAMVTLRNASPR